MLNITTLQHVPDDEDQDYSVMANNCGACSCNDNLMCGLTILTVAGATNYTIKNSNRQMNGTIAPMSVDSNY